MKAQMKAVMASAVAIVLALAAVSGVTYSWFSDSEQANIDVSTGTLDVTLSEFKAVDRQDNPLTINNNRVSLTSLVPGDQIKVSYKVSYDSTINAKYRDVLIVNTNNMTSEDFGPDAINFSINDGDEDKVLSGSDMDQSGKIIFKDTELKDFNGSITYNRTIIIEVSEDYGTGIKDFAQNIRSMTVEISHEIYQAGYEPGYEFQNNTMVDGVGTVSNEENMIIGTTGSEPVSIEAEFINVFDSSDTKGYVFKADVVNLDSSSIEVDFTLTSDGQNYQFPEGGYALITLDIPGNISTPHVIDDDDDSDNDPEIVSSTYDSTANVTKVTFKAYHFSIYIVEDVGISSLDELKTMLSEAGSPGAGNTTLVIENDLDMTGAKWTPIKVDGYNGADIITIEGNGKTIYGLEAPLFKGGFAGGSGIVIKNLTIANSEIISTNTNGSGAFIESIDSMDIITLIDCHLISSSVSGSRTGGLVGWTSGYNNVNDGPVKTYVTIKDCSVINSNITGTGSVGGINGHAGANPWTYTTIENCIVEDCILKSTDSGSWRVGIVIGTANVGEVIINNITESNNEVIQGEAGVPSGQSVYYGRLALGDTGIVTIDGNPIVASDAGLDTVISSGVDKIELVAGKYDLPNSVSGKTITITGDKNCKISTGNGNNGYEALHGSSITFDGVTIVGQSSGQYNGFAHTGDMHYMNCTFEGTMTIYSDSTFENCTFNLPAGCYIWTAWGADTVTYEGCTFNTAGKALLVYHESGTCTVNVSNCTFNASSGDKAGAIANQYCAAIEIDNSGKGVGTDTSCNFVINTSGNTIDSNFSGEWRIKTIDNEGSITVNGISYNSLAVDGKNMVIDDNKNVTVVDS